jgi:hypothetical protein
MSDENRSPTLYEVIRIQLDARTARIRVALPGRVEKYDAGTQKADVAVMLTDVAVGTDGAKSSAPFPVATNVPILFPGSGGFRVTFPVAVGDLVLLVFSDRSTDELLAGDGRAVATPNDPRQHDFSDAVAIPGFHTFGSPLTDAPADHMTAGQQGGLQLHFKPNVLELGLGGDAAALASKVLSELSALSAAIQSHTHLAPPGGGATGPAVIVPPLPLSPGSVESTQLRLES